MSFGAGGTLSVVKNGYGSFAKARAAAIAVLAAVFSMVFAVVPATADPPIPAATDIISVGANTTQAFDNGLSAAYNATHPASNYYSWNAGTSAITPKAGCDTTADPPGAGEIVRADGSDAGIGQLNYNDHTCVDIARSGRAPHSGTTDYFIPFAVDAVGWSAYTGGNAPTNLTSLELKGIFSCQYRTWNSLPVDPASSSDTIDVILPPPGSDTREFFLGAIGVPDVTPNPPCWDTSAFPDENEGTDPAFAGNKDAIYPYSLSHYVGQTFYGRGSGIDQAGALDAQRSIDGISQIVTAYKDWNSGLSTAYYRAVFHVVRASDWNASGPGGTTEQAALKALLGRYNSGTRTGGWLCSLDGQALLPQYGFHLLGAGCGTPQPGI
ncbi:ABC-type phosphate transport system substrate-binding protein [Catenulispora sp. EB89]|uniref:hypothetical protein n=1 Tax=Catenulispora sp. EB89 TaxID=3156257 RepID=UPI0035130AC0